MKIISGKDILDLCRLLDTLEGLEEYCAQQDPNAIAADDPVIRAAFGLDDETEN